MCTRPERYRKGKTIKLSERKVKAGLANKNWEGGVTGSEGRRQARLRKINPGAIRR